MAMPFWPLVLLYQLGSRVIALPPGLRALSVDVPDAHRRSPAKMRDLRVVLRRPRPSEIGRCSRALTGDKKRENNRCS